MTSPVVVKPLHPLQEFVFWRDCLEKKALVGDHDAVVLLNSIHLKLSAHDPERKLSDQQVTGLVRVLLVLAQEHQDVTAVGTLREIARLYNRAGLPLPIPLRQFDPSDYRKKKGRHSCFEQYRTIARYIYEYRKGQGCFPTKNWNIWRLARDLTAEIDAQIATDKGVSNQIDELARKYFCSTSKMKQVYLGDATRKIPHLRRYLVIEDIAQYCLAYWARQFAQTP